MKVGDRVEVILAGVNWYHVGDKGIIVGNDGNDMVFIRFDRDSSAVLDDTNVWWAVDHPGDMGVWAAWKTWLNVIEEAHDEITELNGFIFDGVAQRGKGEWQPDTAIDDVMSVTKGMFE